MIATYCTHCSGQITSNKFYSLGKTFCSSCYSLYYKLRRCVECGKRKRISRELSIPVCQQCEFQGVACVKCEKNIVKVGVVDVDGPVCHSCVVYYRPHRQCEWCGQSKIGVSRRRLSIGEALICNSCFTNLFPTCSSCGYKRKIFFCTFDKALYCKTCVEEVRFCNGCRIEIPAGSGHYCIGCSYFRTLKRRIRVGQKKLSHYLSKLYEDFGTWMILRRSVHFSAIHINKCLPYFIRLNELTIRLGRYPSYQEVVSEFSVATTRKNLLITLFLDEAGIIKVDCSIKDEYSNLDTIERYMSKFSEASSWSAMLKAYYFELLKKVDLGQTTIRSVRLALTPAVKLLLASRHFGVEEPNNDILEGVLWVSPGQRSAITGFINFLNRAHDLGLVLPERSELIVQKPNETKMQLKDRLIRMLRDPTNSDEYRHELLVLGLAYFHQLVVPKNAMVDFNMLKRDAGGDEYIRLVGFKFYLPDRLCYGDKHLLQLVRMFSDKDST